MANIPEVLADFEHWGGRCVRLRGIRVQERLYVDRAAVLEPLTYLAQPKRSMVIYPKGPVHLDRRPVAIEVVGRLGSCAAQNDAIESMQAQHPDSLVTLSGYCHTSLETYVEPISIRVRSRAPILRFTEAELPVEARGLVEAPATLANRPAHLQAARAMLASVATGDEQAFWRLAWPELAEDLDAVAAGKQPEDWLRSRMREMHRVFQDQARSMQSVASLYPLDGRQERFFVAATDLAQARDGRTEPQERFTCWCRTAQCAGRWPVMPIDADNATERPYFCVVTSPYLLGPGRGAVVRAEAPILGPGFAEPAWPDAVGGSTVAAEPAPRH